MNPSYKSLNKKLPIWPDSSCASESHGCVFFVGTQLVSPCCGNLASASQILITSLDPLNEIPKGPRTQIIGFSRPKYCSCPWHVYLGATGGPNEL